MNVYRVIYIRWNFGLRNPFRLTLVSWWVRHRTQTHTGGELTRIVSMLVNILAGDTDRQTDRRRLRKLLAAKERNSHGIGGIPVDVRQLSRQAEGRQ